MMGNRNNLALNGCSLAQANIDRGVIALNSDYVLIKGAGDLASGVACVLHRAGYQVLLTEIEQPTCVRRKVSFAEAIYDGEIAIEGITGKKADSLQDAMKVLRTRKIAVLADPQGYILRKFNPCVFVEATLSKKYTGTSKDDAEIVIALGPGFGAGRDVHAVIETQRGNELGKVIYAGFAAANTGIPGNVLGYTIERVLRAPAAGKFCSILDIGDFVEADQIVGYVDQYPVRTIIGGVVRGLLQSGLSVPSGMKLGDIHPGKNREVCAQITDKAWTVGKGVLLAISTLHKQEFTP
jgi:xanthine dehydrogenase accessory factor